METFAFQAFHTPFQSVRFNLMNPFFLSLIIGSFLGTLNYFYWRSKGYKSSFQLVMSILGFTALAAAIIRVFN
jgi:hypothetical protein